MKKCLCFLLGFCLLLSLAAGCSLRGKSDGAIPIPSAETTSEPTPTAADAGAALNAARDNFPADTVVMTVNGLDATWGEYFYWLANQIGTYYEYTGALPDWAASADGSQTYDEFFRSIAQDNILTLLVTETKARDMGVELSEEAVSDMKMTWDSFVESAGGEEAALSYLEEKYLTKDIYDHYSRVQHLYDALFSHMFGADGEKLGEPEVLEYAGGAGYMRAQHILFATVNSEGEALSEEEKAEKLASAEGTLAELKQASAGELESRFSEKMKELSEDSGLAYFPDGYCFTPGEMTEEFETAVRGLSEGELSGVVETAFGYHIILRLPLDIDAAVVYDRYSSKPLTLRYTVAARMFESSMDNWKKEARVTYKDAFGDFEIASLFGGETL